MVDIASAARRATWWSLLTAGLWIGSGSTALVLTIKLGDYLALMFGVRQGEGGSGLLVFFGIAMLIGAVAVAIFALESARRALVAGRAARRGDLKIAVKRLAGMRQAASLAQWFSLIGALLTFGLSLPAVLWMLSVALGGSGAPDAVASNLTQIVSAYPLVTAGLLAWWPAGWAAAAARSVIAPDGNYWWDGEHWQPFAA